MKSCVCRGNSDITGTQTGILAGTGSRIVHGAELFADGTERTGAEQSADTDEPEITVAPVPTDRTGARCITITGTQRNSGAKCYSGSHAWTGNVHEY